MKEGIEQGVDVVIVDTAGRLQNKKGLMDELGKVRRVAEKGGLHGDKVAEVLLVIDATTGQNGMQQARVFSEAVDVTGIVLTKLDGTAKGGIVVNVQRELGVPVKMVGLGEGMDDLAPFDAHGFVDALLGGTDRGGTDGSRPFHGTTTTVTERSRGAVRYRWIGGALPRCSPSTDWVDRAGRPVAPPFATTHPGADMEFTLDTGGATAWILASAALVLLMTPGLSLFYGGWCGPAPFST